MASPAEPARRRPPVLGIVLFSLVAGGATLFLLLRPDHEPLTREGLDRARARWARAGIPDYDLAVRVTGASQGEHAISVREGKVVAMTTGGAEAARSAWDYWTVPGMFGFLDEELARAATQRGGGGETVLRAAFDEAYGYPRRFLRHQVGELRSIEWEVLEFRPAR